MKALRGALLGVIGVIVVAVSTTSWVAASGSTSSAAPASARSYEQAFSTMQMSAQQTEALEDQRVDEREYRAGFARFRGCLSNAGFELVRVTESNATIQYAVPAEAVDGGVEGACYSVEFEQLDMHWQLDHADTSESTQVMRDCLIENGIVPVGSSEEIGEQLKASGIDMSTCGS